MFLVYSTAIQGYFSVVSRRLYPFLDVHIWWYRLHMYNQGKKVFHLFRRITRRHYCVAKATSLRVLSINTLLRVNYCCLRNITQPGDKCQSMVGFQYYRGGEGEKLQFHLFHIWGRWYARSRLHKSKRLKAKWRWQRWNSVYRNSDLGLPPLWHSAITEMTIMQWNVFNVIKYGKKHLGINP